jgi:hypothetical protein
VLGAPLVFVALGGGIYWFTFGGGRRYLSILVMLLAAAMLAIVAIASFGSFGFGPVLLLPGIAVSAGMGWLGYKLRGWIPPEPSPDPILAAVMTPTPTTRAIGPADVVGQWRFYVDAAASTVTIDLQPGGRYRQVILANSSKHDAACDGDWTLDGPNLELSAYRSATREETARVRWYFGDYEDGLILFVKDDPQSPAMLVARRSANGDGPGQSPFGSDAASSQAKQPSRKAGSRGPALFVAHGRLGHGGK